MGEPKESWADAAREIADECVAGRVRKLSRVITGVYDEELRRHGIRAGQLTILALVATLEQLSPRQISVYLGLEPSTVSRNISRMCTSGWLTTIPGTDSRSHEVIATPKGRRLLEAAFPAWRTAQKQAEELLGGRGFRTVARLADDLPWDEQGF